MSFFSFKRRIYPLVALVFAIFFLVFGLIMSKHQYCIYFLLTCFLILLVFGCHKGCLRLLPMLIIFGGGFSVITYFVYEEDFAAALSMFNRFFSLFLSGTIGSSVSSIRMNRCLVSLHFPKTVTLGMMISSSFPVVLSDESKKVSKAMKSRGAGNVFNPKVLYRAFLIPFIIRIVNISDTLSLSIETRGFTLAKSKTTVYKKESLILSDVIFSLLILAAMVVLLVL